jgi:hypothetical protein
MAPGPPAAAERHRKERERSEMAARKATEVSCEACFFKRNMLCALELSRPCPTFRPAERGLAPERQLAFVFRTERTRAVYAFPQPE